jgi:hypothetical protein
MSSEAMGKESFFTLYPRQVRLISGKTCQSWLYVWPERHG